MDAAALLRLRTAAPGARGGRAGAASARSAPGSGRGRRGRAPLQEGEKNPQSPPGHGEAPPAPAVPRQPQVRAPRAPRDRPGRGWSAAPGHPRAGGPEAAAADTFLVPAAAEIPPGNLCQRLCPTFPAIFTSCSRQGGSGARPQRPPGPGRVWGRESREKAQDGHQEHSWSEGWVKHGKEGELSTGRGCPGSHIPGKVQKMSGWE